LYKGILTDLINDNSWLTLSDNKLIFNCALGDRIGAITMYK